MHRSVMYRFILDTPEATEILGRLLGERAEADNLICLYGDLGSGKTTLAQAIARGLGVDSVVCSPSFAVHHEYAGRLPFHHMDFYRLSGGVEVEAMGLDEYFSAGGVTVIEWAGRAADILPPERVDISLATHVAEQRVALLKAAPSWRERLLAVASDFAFQHGGSNPGCR